MLTLNKIMNIYTVNLRIQSEYKKYGPEKTLYLDTLADYIIQKLFI